MSLGYDFLNGGYAADIPGSNAGVFKDFSRSLYESTEGCGSRLTKNRIITTLMVNLLFFVVDMLKMDRVVIVASLKTTIEGFRIIFLVLRTNYKLR